MPSKKDELKNRLKTEMNKFINALKGKKGPDPLVCVPESADDKKLVDQYIKTCNTIEDLKSRLEGLKNARSEISKERFQALEKKYTEKLQREKNSSEDLLENIGKKIEKYVNTLPEIEDRLKIINQKIDEEAKLLEVGVIKKNEYLKNIVPLKAELKKLEKESQRLKRKKQNLKDSVKNPTKGNIIIPSHESYKYASFSSRLVASLFDIILFGIPLVALAIFVPIIGAIVSSVLGVLYNPYLNHLIGKEHLVKKLWVLL